MLNAERFVGFVLFKEADYHQRRDVHGKIFIHEYHSDAAAKEEDQQPKDYSSQKLHRKPKIVIFAVVRISKVLQKPSVCISF